MNKIKNIMFLIMLKLALIGMEIQYKIKVMIIKIMAKQLKKELKK